MLCMRLWMPPSNPARGRGLRCMMGTGTAWPILPCHDHAFSKLPRRCNCIQLYPLGPALQAAAGGD